MKTQQIASLSGKKLSRTEMKKLHGGATITGVWVCAADGYWGCYATKVRCLIECPEYTDCKAYAGCP
jgi:hypothetical protein